MIGVVTRKPTVDCVRPQPLKLAFLGVLESATVTAEEEKYDVT